MDAMKRRVAGPEPVVHVTLVTQESWDAYTDLVNGLQDVIESIDEPGHALTEDELNRLYDAKDGLAKWVPVLEDK